MSLHGCWLPDGGADVLLRLDAAGVGGGTFDISKGGLSGLAYIAGGQHSICLRVKKEGRGGGSGGGGGGRDSWPSGGIARRWSTCLWFLDWGGGLLGYFKTGFIPFECR